MSASPTEAAVGVEFIETSADDCDVNWSTQHIQQTVLLVFDIVASSWVVRLSVLQLR
jgi:hypothetical protein